MIFSKKALLGSLAVVAFSAILLGNHFYQKNMAYCYLPTETDEVTEMITHRIAFLDKKSGRSSDSRHSIGLIKSKNCEETSTHLSIKPSEKILAEADNYVKVFIENKEYKTFRETPSSSHYSPYYLFWNQKVINRINYNLTIPQYEEFKKDKLSIRCEFYSDGKLVYSIEDNIRYVDNGEEVEYAMQHNTGGPCTKPQYFDNEVLYALHRPGWYKLEKDMITTITKEDDKFKLVSTSPSGFLVYLEDKSYQVPVPAFPEDIRYLDLSANLTPGVYKRAIASDYGRMIEVTAENKGKYPSFNYNLERTSTEKTISFEDCELIVHDSKCNYIPLDIYVTLEDYPKDMNNVYTSL